MKIVITGGPCSGKTTIINELKIRGFTVVEEAARKVIEERKHLPLTKEEMKERQRLIFEQQNLEETKKLDEPDVIFDRSLIDSVAYNILFQGKFPEKSPEINFLKRYDLVFILDLLPFEYDGTRIENGPEEANKIHGKLKEVYSFLNYNLIDVPVMPVKERAEFIIKNMS